MRWRGAQTAVGTALALLAVGVLAWLIGAVPGSASDRATGVTPAPAGATPAAVGVTSAPAGVASAPASITSATASAAPGAGVATDPPDPPTVYAIVDPAPLAAPLPAGFLGFSFEYSALEAYTGADPAALDPVFVQLLRNLAPPGQPIVLRVGGNSTDATWWPVRGQRPPAGVTYDLTPAWLAETRALAAAVGARLILGVNLAASRPGLAAAEANALLSGIGPQFVAAFEIGNEPDVYGMFPWYSGLRGPVFARPAGYDLGSFIRQVVQWGDVLPAVPLAGPAVAKLPWLAGLPALVQAAPRLRVVTAHRYPIQGCQTNTRSPYYPSVSNLLSDRSAGVLASAIGPYAVSAHAHGLQFRVDELNSAALAGCLGRTGVSDTFASALWMLDTLFDLASVGVDGVNIHSLPTAAYEPFTFRHGAAGWQAFVHPDYYGMLMFSQAFPAGARLLPVHTPAGPMKVWATRAPDGSTRVTLINKDSRPHRVELQVSPAPGQARLEWLRAPTASATGGVTLGGQSFGPETATGRLAAPVLEPVSSMLGWYSVEVPADSAALLTR